MTDEFNQNSMGFNSNTNVFRSYFTSRNFNNQHLIAYAESHDEQRLMYRNLNNGNSGNPSHNVRNLGIALDRQEAIAAILYSIPGPKMLWQFGELGYEIDINANGRTGRKPIPWTLNYDTDTARTDLYNVTATMIGFKTMYPETFNNTNNNLDLGGLVKRINLNGPQFDAVVVANFNVTTQNVTPNFSQTGVWYEYFSSTTLNVTNTTAPVSLAPGAYRVYSTQPLINPLGNEDVFNTTNSIKLYPNPASASFELSQEVDAVTIYNLQGQQVLQFVNGNQQTYDISTLSTGTYIIELITNEFRSTQKLLKM
jgi:hypothetical protein